MDTLYNESSIMWVELLSFAVSKSEGDVSVRISDLGGGVAREQVEEVWQYQFTTSNPASRDRNVCVPCAGGLESHHHPMHGLGYGLPLSRVYARYFQVLFCSIVQLIITQRS